MAQCYARDAANGGLEDCLQRLQAYEEVAGVDWVQFESPHSVDEIQQARARVAGPLSFMRGKLPRYLSLDEHQALGVHIAWYPAFTHEVMYAALWDFMQDFQARGLAAWEAFQASRQGRPYPHPLRLEVGETVAKQRELEERYLSPSGLAKYAHTPGSRRPAS
jgi:2-methylisocitrate lyase-like PEP mutase family enzyme